ncbi:MAG: YdeI/OmpD-associated family protein, partial [Actinomycetota bacterium]
GIEVPAEVVESLGGGKHPKVRVTIGGHAYRSSVASVGGRFMFGVSADVRGVAGVTAGDVVDVELDTEPRVVEVPPDLAEALAKDAGADAFFQGLSYSKQRWHVLSVEGAKTPETRQRRIAKSVTMLHEGRAR